MQKVATTSRRDRVSKEEMKNSEEGPPRKADSETFLGREWML